MSGFNLYRDTKVVLPATVSVNGSPFSVRPNYKTVLKILDMLEDEEVSEVDKMPLICKLFYKPAPELPPIQPAVEAFSRFVSMGQEAPAGGSDEPPTFDLAFDAAEIYASFRQLYHIDLLAENFHWYVFKMLLGGALTCDTPLREKVRLRQRDPDKYEDPVAVRRMQDAVRIPDRMSVTERYLQAELTRRLKNHESTDGLFD